MKTLAQHNAERHKEHSARNDIYGARPNGIECPQCKSELMDSNPMVILTSSPPQKNVHCRKCGYRGYRVA